MHRKILVSIILSFAVVTILGSGEALGQVEFDYSPVNAPVSYFYSTEDFNFDSDQGENGDAIDAGEAIRSVSRTKAVLMSLAVPGAGQIYADASGRGEVFLGAEIAIWISYFAYHAYGNMKEDDYINYAVRYAGIDPDGKDEEFYRNLTFYDNREEYNESGRIIDPSSPYYAPNSGYDWYWESDSNRQLYRHYRNKSETAFRKATFMIGLAVFNRILSGIDAYRVARNKSHEIQEDNIFGRHNIDIDLKGNPFGSNPRVGFEITRKF